MLGHYTILGAKGPGTDLFWSQADGWVTDQANALVFSSVQEAQHTPIVGLPAGYKPVLVQATVVVTPPDPDPSPCPPNPC